MAGNQREMARREKLASKDKKHRIIIWIIIAAIILILAVMKVCEININSIKDRFIDENGKFKLTQEAGENDFVYNLDSSDGVVMSPINKKIGVMTSSSFTVLDSSNADSVYTFNHGYSNPMLSTAGIYSLIFDQGAKSFRLDTTNDNVYVKETQNSILCASAAKNGTVVCVSVSKEKKSDITVYSKALDEKLSYQLSYGYVVAVAINESANKIAFAAVNSENAQLKTKIYTMNIGDTEPRGVFDVDSGAVISLKYNGRNLYAVGDSFVLNIKNQKECREIFASGKINTQCFDFTPSGNLVLVYNDYDNSSENTLVYIKSNGKIKASADILGNITDVCAQTNRAYVLAGDEIVAYSLKDCTKKSSQSVGDNAKAICCLGSETFVFRQSLIERNEAENS